MLSYRSAAVLALFFHAIGGIPIRHDIMSSESAQKSASFGTEWSEASGVDFGAPIKWGDINILHLTDEHSWLSGHKHEASIQADYADVLSFYSHLHNISRSMKKDLWFFNRYALPTSGTHTQKQSRKSFETLRRCDPSPCACLATPSASILVPQILFSQEIDKWQPHGAKQCTSNRMPPKQTCIIYFTPHFCRPADYKKHCWTVTA
jgi:hypothetical protein